MSHIIKRAIWNRDYRYVYCKIFEDGLSDTFDAQEVLMDLIEAIKEFTESYDIDMCYNIACSLIDIIDDPAIMSYRSYENGYPATFWAQYYAIYCTTMELQKKRLQSIVIHILNKASDRRWNLEQAGMDVLEFDDHTGGEMLSSIHPRICTEEMMELVRQIPL